MARKRRTTDPRSLQFWEDEAAEMWDVLAPTALKIMFAGAKAGHDLLPANMRVLVNWDRVNENAIRWLRDWRGGMLQSINDYSQRQTVRAIDEWIRSGEHLSVLETQLTPLLGDERARRIAVTEVTRVYAEGNRAAWKASGLVKANKWQTGVDDKVCEICAPLHGVVAPLDEGFTPDGPGLGPMSPPAHVGCRCYLLPVVSEAGLREEIRGILGD